jgi:ABC-type transport system involved in cytochrome bd biosynthesis fused ATPase/permease subunit
LDGSEFILRDISLSVNAHELVMVVGAVGAGKSSLLNAILDEMTLVVTSTNECTGSARQLRPNCRIAYCAQRPWILAGTARSNIVLAGDEANQHSSSMPLNEDIASFLRLDKQEIDLDSLDHVDLAIRNQNYDVFKNPIRINDTLYQKAVESCQLSNDFELWPHGDMTEIGERGISISGGQKARIALARAIYSDSDCKS